MDRSSMITGSVFVVSAAANGINMVLLKYHVSFVKEAEQNVCLREKVLTA